MTQTLQRFLLPFRVTPLLCLSAYEHEREHQCVKYEQLNESIELQGEENRFTLRVVGNENLKRRCKSLQTKLEVSAGFLDLAVFFPR